MTTKEKNLKKGAKAFDLLQQIKKYANACFEQGTPEYEAVIHSVSILEKNFEPYSIQFKKIRDEKQQKELVAKETCAREGHTGEWHEQNIPFGQFVEIEVSNVTVQLPKKIGLEFVQDVENKKQ